MATNHTKTLAQYLRDQGIAEVYASPPFQAQEDEAPVTRAFIMPTGGPVPQSMFGQTETIDQAVCQVMVVSAPDASSPAYSMARDIYSTLKNTQPTDYIIVQMNQSQPLYLGADSDQRHRYSINVTATIEE